MKFKSGLFGAALASLASLGLGSPLAGAPVSLKAEPTQEAKRPKRRNRKTDRNTTRVHRPTPYGPMANLSRRHPDYGYTPRQHEERKVKRAAGKLRWVDMGKSRSLNG